MKITLRILALALLASILISLFAWCWMVLHQFNIANPWTTLPMGLWQTFEHPSLRPIAWKALALGFIPIGFALYWISDWSNDAQVAWQPATMTRLSAFVPESRALAVGDLVRVTANDRGRDLVNGDLARVAALDVEEGLLTLALADGRSVRLNSNTPLTLDYGYCSTVHSAQGQTCERVMIEADAHSLTSGRNTFYVAISRARETAKIYTDDREMLPLAMGREMTKESALDLERYEVCLD